MTIEAPDLIAKANPHIKAIQAALLDAEAAAAPYPEVLLKIKATHDAAGAALKDLKALVGDATDPTGAQLDDGTKAPPPGG